MRQLDDRRCCWLAVAAVHCEAGRAAGLYVRVQSACRTQSRVPCRACLGWDGGAMPFIQSTTNMNQQQYFYVNVDLYVNYVSHS